MQERITPKLKQREAELNRIDRVSFELMLSRNCSQSYDEYRSMVQAKLDSTTPWIGVYIAAASAACTFSMMADAIIGFRSKKYWLPCKYFSLNAFSLTLLAVTMKLPVDLTSIDLNVKDKLPRISSLVLMCAGISHFMTSLGSMENNEILLNIAALGILVITIAGNVCIHTLERRSFPNVRDMLLEQVASAMIMLLVLATLCSLAVMVPGARRYMQLKYNEMHKSVSNRELEWGRTSIDEVGVLVKGYWVMAETGSPQFVVARSAISSASGLLYLLAVVTFAVAVTLTTASPNRSSLAYCIHVSEYNWSVIGIGKVQSLGVMVGSIAPLSRWFVASWLKISEMERKSLEDELKVDKYWTWRLLEWRDTSPPFQIQNRVCKKLLCDAVKFVLNFCIGAQILFVSSAKLVLFLSARFGSAVFLCFCKNLKRPDSVGAEMDFSNYVLVLEGEPQLPDKILNNICNEADRLIQIGEKKQPKNLIRLLKKSANFNGVGQFDSSQVPSLHSQEPPNCWSLPLVTLTTISVALANVADDEASQLLASVSEGLSIVKLIEKTLDKNGELESIRKAADVVWVGVEVYGKWDYKDLKSASVRGATNKETLLKLSDIAGKIVTDFMAQTRDAVMQNPLNWPVRVIAANSMYRIAETMLVGMEDEEEEEEVFERISMSISEIVAACLTNLVRVIQFKCHTNDVKERQESVRRAAILLGESKEILEILQERELPSLDMERAANIDEWRRASMVMALDIENP
ncbi:uncharacterized protein LOC131023306 [Salvia miltiorrhiza]|uniref:uncharacterized protein LOC131023306 n=1 Tax=Salvia miltiorrhiza TaxID=226208 RepID=UPI0025AC2054|nr:uncharacterized protein LOC131023306 [Salvia miltiorrhiza]